MSAPDDLPRSPSGRIPQWVVDEASGVPTAPTGWRTPEAPAPRPRRRRTGPIVAVVALAAAFGGAWWVTSGMPGLSQLLEPPTWAAVPVADLPPAPPPSADVVALADSASLSDEGRALFYGTRPEILDATAFQGRCVDPETGHGSGAVGCYQPATNTMVLYLPADPRLRGFTVESAAHETLHAAWARLSPADQAVLAPLLEAEVASLPADARVLEQIAGSVGAHPENRPTELFAYVGTQIWRDGGLAPELEAAYGDVVANRSALVAVHTGWEGLLEQLHAEILAASQALSDRQLTNAMDRAQYDADAATLAGYRASYEAQAAEVAALAPEQRDGLRLSWVWWDGTDLPMAPAEQTLAAAAALLARDDDTLAARAATLQAADDAAAAERARIDGLVADLDALQGQLAVA
ncbi:MAG: hypothetical protein ABWY33_04035 [Cellulomonas sp.]